MDIVDSNIPLGPAGVSVLTSDDLFPQIVQLLLQNTSEDWYRSVIPHFPRLRLYSLYPKKSLRLSKHRETSELTRALKQWKVFISQRTFFNYTFTSYINLKLLELPIPRSLQRCHHLASVLFLTALTELNIQTRFDDFFMEKAQVLILGCPHLRVFRVKHIAYYSDALCLPWQQPEWFTMLSALYLIDVFYLNTPLLLTRKSGHADFVKPWLKFMPKVKRIYLAYGYDEEAEFSTAEGYVGESIVLVLRGKEKGWASLRIRSANRSRTRTARTIPCAFSEDKDPFGPDEDIANGMVDPDA